MGLHRCWERVRTSAKPIWFDSDKCFIDGRWIEPQSGRRLPLEDPSRGVEIGEIARGEAADIDAAVDAAEPRLAANGASSPQPSAGGCS